MYSTDVQYSTCTSSIVVSTVLISGMILRLGITRILKYFLYFVLPVPNPQPTLLQYCTVVHDGYTVPYALLVDTVPWYYCKVSLL